MVSVSRSMKHLIPPGALSDPQAVSLSQEGGCGVRFSVKIKVQLSLIFYYIIYSSLR